MASGTTNIDELLSILNISETDITTNVELKEDIVDNGGTVLYTYSNIIIASEISEEYFNELQNNSEISFIMDLPLKKYGDVSIVLDDVVVTALSATTTDQYKNTDSTLNTISDGVVGNAKKTTNNNVVNNDTYSSSENIVPSILNTNFDILIQINSGFSYEFLLDGTTPMIYEYTKPSIFSGELYFENNILKGSVSESGTYSIFCRIQNEYGYDQKTIKLVSYEEVKITNDTFEIHNLINTYFSYTIETTGDIEYITVDNLPSELTLNGNTITGTLITENQYTLTITAHGITDDVEDLIINVGSVPLITSLSSISVEQYTNFIYNITSNTTNVEYAIKGILPNNLKLNGDAIEGIAMYEGSYELKIKASNEFGVSYKDLKIIIYNG